MSGIHQSEFHNAFTYYRASCGSHQPFLNRTEVNPHRLTPPVEIGVALIQAVQVHFYCLPECLVLCLTEAKQCSISYQLAVLVYTPNQIP